MPSIANAQTDFSGGIWSETAQGRFDDPLYKTALNESLNGFPVQERSWSRRPGFIAASRTKDGKPGVLHSLSVTASPSHAMEFTDGNLRFFKGANLLTDDTRNSISSISGAKPAVVTTATIHGWATNDRVLFKVEGFAAGEDMGDLAPLLYREFQIVVTGFTTFKLYDADTKRAINGADISFDAATMQLSVARVIDLVTPYDIGKWANLTVIQDDKQGIVLTSEVAPQVIALNNQTIQFAIEEADFIDGPYLDPIEGVVATAITKTGVVDLKFGYEAWKETKSYSEGVFVGIPGTIYGYRSLSDLNLGNDPSTSPAYWKRITNLNGFANNGAGITEEDIGRHVRLFSEPPLWLPNTVYEANVNVKFNKVYYTALAAITAVADVEGKTNPKQPGLDPTLWIANPAAGRWTWGKIVRARPVDGVTAPALPGTWHVPGFHLVSDCGRLDPFTGDPLAPYDLLSGCADFASTGCSGGGSQDYSPFPAIQTPGIDFDIAASDADSFIIAVCDSSSGLFGSIGWPPAQFWERDPGSLDPPSQPIFTPGTGELSGLEGLPGTPIGNLTQDAGLNQLFLVGASAKYASRPGNTGYAGLLLDTPSPISSGRVFPIAASDEVELGFSIGGSTKSITAKLWANTSAPSNETDGTLLGTTVVTGPITSGAPIVVTSNNLATSFNYVWMQTIVTTGPSNEDNNAPYGGGFAFGGLSTFAVGASKMEFFDDANIPAGTDIGVQLEGDDLLYVGQITDWRLGRYNGHIPTYPKAGAFYAGRLWLGSLDGGWAASRPNKSFDFAPTEPDGSVTEGNGFAFNIISDAKNDIHWMKAEDQGVLVGTASGEWMLNAPDSGSPISATNVVADPISSYGSAPVTPVVTTLTTVFVHKNQAAVQEVMRDAYSGKFAAPSLQEKTQSLTEGGIVKLAYQKALTPFIWGCDKLGGLFGTTYKRDNRISLYPPTYNGWHRHSHGNDGRKIISLCTNASLKGDLDALTVMTQDEAGVCRVEVLTDLMPAKKTTSLIGYHLDGGIVPHSAAIESTGVRLYGLWGLNNKEVTAMIAGLDCGEHAVIDGQMFVLWESDTDGLLTRRHIDEVSVLGLDFGQFGVGVSGLARVPMAVGYTYKSRGQRLRPVDPGEAGSPVGPALAVIKRNSKFGVLLNNTKGVKFGGDFDHLKPIQYASGGGIQYAATELYSGVYDDTIDDDATFDGMIAWETERPFPTNICALGGFIVSGDG